MYVYTLERGYMYSIKQRIGSQFDSCHGRPLLAPLPLVRLFFGVFRTVRRPQAWNPVWMDATARLVHLLMPFGHVQLLQRQHYRLEGRFIDQILGPVQKLRRPAHRRIPFGLFSQNSLRDVRQLQSDLAEQCDVLQNIRYGYNNA